jgi:type 1 glutamine amidotransferase/sugar phosphate isomerase/epimerase
MTHRWFPLLTVVLASALPSTSAQAEGQSPVRQPGAGEATARPTINMGPASGKQATRWEPWSAMRMGSATILGWKIGIDADVIPNQTLATALEDTDALKLSYIEASSDQQLSNDIPKKVDYNLQPGEMQAIKDKLFGLNIQIVAYRIPTIEPDEAASRKVFAFAKDLKIDTLVVEHTPKNLALIDKLAGEYGINAAFCGDLKTVLAAVQPYSKRLGVCADTGTWLEQGVKPMDALSEVKDRLLVIGLRDRSALATGGHSVALGTGAADIPQFLREMYRLEIKPSLLTVGATGATGSMANLSRSLDDFDNSLRPLMAEKVEALSRNATRRGPDLVSAEDKQKIDAALPNSAPAKPKKPRKLLVLDFNVAYGGHRSIPAENYALDMMGKRTGAYEAVFNDDLDNLKYPKIKEYDAIYLNNTVGMIFVDPAVREGLLRFVRDGGGLGGNHSTTHASMDWPEFHEMIGATRGVHRQSNEQFWVKIDDPKSPITAPFHGQDFEYADEFFRFVGPLYSRDKLHVLMSMDVQRTDMNQGVPFMPGTLSRPDNDYAVSWIRSYGKGRVYFSILGHNPTLFQSPELAQSFLAAIQFILGDLDADTTPSAQIRAK